eukprot:472897-Prymnesium_polylepis.1
MPQMPPLVVAPGGFRTASPARSPQTVATWAPQPRHAPLRGHSTTARTPVADTSTSDSRFSAPM